MATIQENWSPVSIIIFAMFHAVGKLVHASAWYRNCRAYVVGVN